MARNQTQLTVNHPASPPPSLTSSTSTSSFKRLRTRAHPTPCPNQLSKLQSLAPTIKHHQGSLNLLKQVSFMPAIDRLAVINDAVLLTALVVTLIETGSQESLLQLTTFQSFHTLPAHAGLSNRVCMAINLIELSVREGLIFLEENKMRSRVGTGVAWKAGKEVLGSEEWFDNECDAAKRVFETLTILKNFILGCVMGEGYQRENCGKVFADAGEKDEGEEETAPGSPIDEDGVESENASGSESEDGSDTSSYSDLDALPEGEWDDQEVLIKVRPTAMGVQAKKITFGITPKKRVRDWF